MNADSGYPQSGNSGSGVSKSGTPESGNSNPGADSSARDAAQTASLLLRHQPLVGRLFEETSNPSWSCTRERFEAALERSAAKRFPTKDVPSEKLEEYLGALHLQDLALAVACAEGNIAAWEFFVATYRPYLRSAAAAIQCGAGSSSAARELADSLFADLYGLSEAKRGERSLFRYFHGRSSLKTWLRAVLAQRHIDAVRESRRFTNLDADPDADPGRHERLLFQHGPDPARIQSPPDPHRGRYVALFTRTLQVALSLLDPCDLERLQLYYVSEQTLAQIGRRLGEHESSVSRNLDRIRRELRSEVESALRNPRIVANGSKPEPGLSEEQISICFQYASEDAPIDLDKLFPASGPGGERIEP